MGWYKIRGPSTEGCDCIVGIPITHTDVNLPGSTCLIPFVLLATVNVLSPDARQRRCLQQMLNILRSMGSHAAQGLLRLLDGCFSTGHSCRKKVGRCYDFEQSMFSGVSRMLPVRGGSVELNEGAPVRGGPKPTKGQVDGFVLQGAGIE